MCRESDPLPLAESLEDALRLFYGGSAPPAEPECRPIAKPQNEKDAEPAELVA